MNLEKFLQDNYGYNPDIKDDIKSYITLWRGWYEGNVKNFHNYSVYNGQQMVRKTRYSLNMAKEISEDWSDILWSEKCEISLANENSQEQFDELVDKLDIYKTINQALEKSGALGTCAVVTSVCDIIQNEDEMTLHKLKDNGNYVIYNHLFRDTNSTLTEIKGKDDTITEFDTQSNIKWFSIFEPLLTNNLFTNNPFGIPHYANALDVLKTVDIDFDAFKNEVRDGEKRTFISADLLNYDSGEQKLTFDPEATDIYVLPKGANKDDLIQSDTEALRTSEQINALNTSLNILGSKVGFGENHYHFDGTNLSTATAVVSSNSKLFRRKKKLEIGYESAIYDLVNAICYASTKFGQYNIQTEDMVIQFDDSIIEDKEAESIRALREYNAGIISAVEYRERIFGETTEIAEKAVQTIKEQEPKTEDLMKE